MLAGSRSPGTVSLQRAVFATEETREAGSELAGATLLVPGSGRRLREIASDPQGNLAVIQIEEDGHRAHVYTARRRLFARPTSELVTHVGVHRWAVARTDTNFHAVVHAQPLHIVYLSHLLRYQETGELNRRLLRWQPETIVQVPDGVGYTPYTLPGSPDLIVRSATSVKKAVDLIEYVEVAARYEYLNRMHSGPDESDEDEIGLSVDDPKALCVYHGVGQTVFP